MNVNENQSGVFFTRNNIATAIAILFHVIGLVGILFFNRDFFIQTTAVNLLLMFLLLLYTQHRINVHLLLFVLLCFITGFGIEIIGTSTGLVFGDYKYGNVLGPAFFNVPLVIGINWFIVIYCAGVTVHKILGHIINQVPVDMEHPRPALKALSVIVDGATTAVLFDWLMEPVAIKLDFWQWSGQENIPFYNYICWFAVSAFLLSVFHWLKFDKNNKFAVNLLLIQSMFFLLLRTFL